MPSTLNVDTVFTFSSFEHKLTQKLSFTKEQQLLFTVR